MKRITPVFLSGFLLCMPFGCRRATTSIYSLSSRDRIAISNAIKMNHLIIICYKKLIDKNNDITPADVWIALVNGKPFFKRPLAPYLQNSENPLLSNPGAPPHAFSMTQPMTDQTLSYITSSSADLGVVNSYLLPRNTFTGKPAVACTSVKLSHPYLDASKGITDTFTLFSEIK